MKESRIKISIDPTAGFCWGVVRTIRIAEEEMNTGNRLASLGDIIHNPSEISRMESLGMKTVARDELESIPRDTKVLIRAHGEPPSTYRLAQRLGLELVDATCPVVTKLQERLRRYVDDGYQIVIFGKKDHAEVIGLRGVCNDECVVVKNTIEAERSVDPKRKTVLFSQTTMDKPTFQEVRDCLERRIKELIVDSAENVAVEFHAKDTICGQVSGREQRLRDFAASNDAMVFVAGKKSSNGQVLYEICRDANPRTYFIEDEAELDPNWFTGVVSVGVSGATSTPQWLMARIASQIRKLTENLEKDDESAEADRLPIDNETNHKTTAHTFPPNGVPAAASARRRKACSTQGE